MSVDHCKKCGEILGKNDMLLCNKCMEEWSNWKDEKGFRYNWDRIRKIREAWYEGEDLP